MSNKPIQKLLTAITPPVVKSALQLLIYPLKFSLAKNKISGHTKLHLACGSNVIDGWANVDIEGGSKVIKWDLTRPLPAQSDSIQFIYCEHFIEHIPLANAEQLISECYRVLQDGGILRFSTPDLKKLVEEYSTGKISEWEDIGWKPTTPCRMLNEGVRLWGHEFVYDFDELKETLKNKGFTKINRVDWRQSEHNKLKDLECRPFHSEIILEAIK